MTLHETMSNTTKMAREPVDTPITRVVKRINSFWPSIAFGIAILIGMGKMIAQQDQIVKQLTVFQTWIDNENIRRQAMEIQLATVLERMRAIETIKSSK